MITPKERIIKVFNKEIVDRPPCICPGGMMNMITTELMDKVNIFWPNAHLNGEKMAQLAKANYENGCFENYGVPFCMTIEAESLGAKITLGSKEFAVKYINKIIENLQTEKIGTIVHICGQMRSVYKEVNMINSDVFSFDSIVSMKNARENLPNRILMGNISTYALEFGTSDKISSLTNKCIKDGSNIISPACGLGTKSPLKNIQSILNTLKQEETKINA